MFERIRKWQEKNRQRSRLEALSDADLRDFGLARRELEALAGVGPEVIDRQRAMAERHGLGGQDLRRHPQDLVSSVKACAACGHTGDCARYLASDAPASASAGFCPNHDLYQQLAAG